ncbi:MAG: hypothetical protein D6816_15225 [Bacteroidetes bacterium]|nr:MAG: hypothetical protein D6816_15225 [Bacteroidota bacterium]
MDKKSSRRKRTRIPPEHGGIQVNFCKNPACENFGVAASQKVQRGAGTKKDGYTVVAAGKGVPVLHCHTCNEYPPIKSNQGIHEELQRMLEGLPATREAACPHVGCANQSVGVSTGKQFYSSYGKSSSGAPRFKCKACGKVFNVSKPAAKQSTSHKNKLVFKLLMNKTPFRRICEVADINPKTLYDKIDFLHRQCLAFAAERERALLEGKRIRRLYVSVDRQDYIVNWSRREDKRNTKLTAVGSADNETGYVFGMHLNYDSSLNPEEIEHKAIEAGDYDAPFPFRRHARLWLQGDYDEAIRRSVRRRSSGDLMRQVHEAYEEAGRRKDVEASEHLSPATRLPARGMQVHSEYTLYGHFLFLHKLFGGVDKVRFFLDQDSGMRAACLAAFHREIKARTCDAFYVRIKKEITIDEKRCALAESRRVFREAQKAHPDLSEAELKLMLIKQRMAQMTEIGQWKDRWLLHPFPNMSEPGKAICHLTDYGDYDEDHLAWLYNKASMHAIDCFFMQVRRRLSLLERSISPASRARRMWHGYAAYRPDMIAKMLDIFRVYYNFCIVGKAGETPAMRMGLAKGPVSEEQIIYFEPI